MNATIRVFSNHEEIQTAWETNLHPDAIILELFVPTQWRALSHLYFAHFPFLVLRLFLAPVRLCLDPLFHLLARPKLCALMLRSGIAKMKRKNIIPPIDWGGLDFLFCIRDEERVNDTLFYIYSLTLNKGFVETRTIYKETMRSVSKIVRNELAAPFRLANRTFAKGVIIGENNLGTVTVDEEADELPELLSQLCIIFR